MTDGIAWLAEPQCLSYEGYSVVMSRELASDELVSRMTRTVFNAKRRAHAIGELTHTQVHDVLEGFYGEAPHDGLALRHGESGEWSFAVKCGGWPCKFGAEPPLSRGGAHIFQLEHDEQNMKSVPPQFAYRHDGRDMCAFNLHLDGSWGPDGVIGDPEIAPRVEAVLTAAGLPDHDLDPRTVHRTSLEVLESLFELSLPRDLIVTGTLPAAVLRAG
ncbi:hypothetical protein [Streptomyces sp. AC512_CC834]|uniref:hypothetical protein n=1 Tax=Streptomyces sp. AC512_CC834 TaxID=2823691 RepID=UPI001C28142A|nr:hypothetical protein [Streptomyces sp. AC512_CC834]